MIATIAGTAVASVTFIIASLRRNTNSNHQQIRIINTESERGSLAAPPFALFLCRLGSALKARMFRERRAPQKRCD